MKVRLERRHRLLSLLPSGGGKDRFLEYWEANQGDAKPRDISDKLNILGFIALKSVKRLIDVACLETASM